MSSWVLAIILKPLASILIAVAYYFLVVKPAELLTNLAGLYARKSANPSKRLRDDTAVVNRK